LAAEIGSRLGPVRLVERPKPRVCVPDAIESVLSSSCGSSMRMFEIHAAVELFVDAAVPRSTVKNALRSARFQRVAEGRYRLARPMPRQPR
jgi:hypothetical protein